MKQLIPNKPMPQAFIISGLIIALIFTMLIASGNGAVHIPWQEIPNLLFANQAENSLLHNVLLDIRIPRVLFSALTGATLAITGVTIQALFRNPLAEPGLIGISSGAALGAVIAIVMGLGDFFVIAGFAFTGSLIATWLAYAIGARYRGVAGLLLAGIAINAIAGSLIGVFSYIANDTELRDLTFWSMGSLAAASWQNLLYIGPWVLLLLLYLLTQWRALNALLLGEREAIHLGFDLIPIRRRLIIVTALIIGPLIAITGGIGFVGLVVPHLVRMIFGANHRIILPVSIIVGALLLTLADLFARVVIVPAELPIGIVTSLIGGPFFFWLLLRARTIPNN